MNEQMHTRTRGWENIHPIDRIMRLFAGIFVIVYFLYQPPENMEYMFYIDLVGIVVVMTALVATDPIYAFLSWIADKLVPQKIIYERATDRHS